VVRPVYEAKVKSSAERIAEDKLKEFYAKAQAELENRLPEPDKKDVSKLSHCAEYAGGIYTYLRERQKLTTARHGYMKNQPELNEKMRGILMDWICAVSEKFNLLSETTFLAANLIDRYFELEKVTKAKIQLVGVTALIIASKYEEIYPPDIRDFVHVTEKAVTKEEVIKMEAALLHKLKFELSVPSTLRFMERFCKLMACNEQTTHFAHYFIELQLPEYAMLRHLPSLVAAGAVYLAQRVIKGSSVVWNEYSRTQSGHSEEEVKQCAKEILGILQVQEKGNLQATRKKFSKPKYMEVAKIKLDYGLMA